MESGEESWVDLGKPFAIVGRGSDADLSLNHLQVSRRHVYLQALEQGVFWIDLASRMGVKINGETQTFGWLTPTDVMSVGPFELRLSGSPSDTTIPITPQVNPLMNDPSASRWPPIRLVFDTSKLSIPTWTVQSQMVLIGRSVRCRIRINSQEVSGFHCALIRTDAGLWLVSLLGRETLVNGISVRSTRLKSDDELQIGNQTIRVRYDVPPIEMRVDAIEERPSLVPTTLPARVGQHEEPGQMLSRLVAGSSPEQVAFAETLLVPLVQQFSKIQQDMVDQFQQTMMGMFNAFGSLYQEQMTEFKQELEEIRLLTTELQTLQSSASLTSMLQDTNEIIPKVAEIPIPSEPAVALPNVETNPPGRNVRADMSNSAEIHAILNQRIAAIQTERQTRLQRVMQMILGRN